MKKYLKVTQIILVMTMLISNSLYVLGAETDNLGSWETKKDCPIISNDVISVNDKIYIVQSTYNDDMEIYEYDALSDIWTFKSSIEGQGSDVGVVECNGKIYFMGGKRDYKTYNSIVKEYDPLTDTWTTKLNMPTKKMPYQLTELDGKIYVIGGRTWKDKDVYLNTVEVYDPLTNTWTTKKSKMRGFENERYNVVSCNSKIYVIGGFDNNETYEYDPMLDTWTKKANMSIQTKDAGAVEINNKIYVIGGSNKTGHLSIVEEYNPITDKWTTKASMPSKRSYLGAVTIDDKIYAIGSDRKGTVEVFTPPTDNKVDIDFPKNLIAHSITNYITLKWDAVDCADSYTILRSTTSDIIDNVIETKVTDTTYIDNNVEPGVTYYYVVRAVKDGVESEDSNVASATIKALDKKIKLVLEVNEQKQLSITDDLTDNTKMAWTSSDTNIATVDANGKVKALEPGDTVVTCENEDGSYTETINVLVVDLDLQLAVDLNIGEKCRLTVSDLNNVKVTWKADDSTIATVSTKGKVTAISEGLTYITALDETGKKLGRIYVRIR